MTRKTYKTKIAHMLDNGDKLELEAFVEAEGHDDAFEQAQARFSAIIQNLSQAGSIDIDRSKVESGTHPH